MAPRKPIKATPKPEQRPEPKFQPKAEKKITDPNEPGIGQKFKAFITDERTRFVIGLGLLLGVLFMFLSFISYFFTGAADQSKMELSFGELQKMRNDIQNWASVTGAVLAETFINRWFGISSFAILYLGVVLGLRLMKVHVTALWKAFFHSSFWLVWLSVLLAFALRSFYKDYLFFSPGGQHGDGVSNWLISYVGFPGTLIIIIGAFLVYCIVISKATIPFLKRLFSRK